MSKEIVQYFVEGECEEKIINSLKISPHFIFRPGKVTVYNFIAKIISDNRIALLKKGTTIVLVYDIDVNKTDILEENIKKLKDNGFNKIIHIQSIENFEDEITYSTNICKINDFFGTKDIEEFKNKFINHKNIASKLKDTDFQIEKFWSRVNKNKPFNSYSNKDDLNFIKNKQSTSFKNDWGAIFTIILCQW